VEAGPGEDADCAQALARKQAPVPAIEDAHVAPGAVRLRHVLATREKSHEEHSENTWKRFFVFVGWVQEP